MRRVRSVVLALMLAALLAACAPASPAPTAVPPTVTAAPTNTVAPTATLAPTLTPIPTDVPTPVPTQEDFSDIEYANSIDEAADKKPVSTKDVTSGLLIDYIKSIYGEQPPPGATPTTFSLYNIAGSGNLVFNPEQDNPDIERMGVFRLDEGYGFNGLMIEVFRFVQLDGTYGYYQLALDLKMFDDDPRTLKSVKKMSYQLPHYKSKYQDHNIEWLAEFLKQPSAYVDVKSLWYIDYYEKVQPLMDEWLETGIIPEELSKMPLFPTTKPIFD